MTKLFVSPAMLDRAAGVLVGQAIGDALGAGYEFAQPVTPEAAAMIGGGLGNWKPGQWTDDTEQAIIVAQAASLGGDLGYHAETVGGGLLRWYAQGPADVGIQTAGILAGCVSSSELTVRAEAWAAENARSDGNGSLMRTGPVALSALGDDDAIARAARAISSLTHAGTDSTDACVLWSIAIDRAIREQRLDGVYDGIMLLAPERRAVWKERIDEARRCPAELFTPNGYVVTAFQAALASIFQTTQTGPQGFEHIIRRAVSIGDDTDTVAAIAGALAGARYGASAMPWAWKRMLNGWPGMCEGDLVRLAAAAAMDGNNDRNGWPNGAELTSHYREAWPQEPFVVTSGLDEGLWLGNVTGLTQMNHIDAVVSLCRLGQDELADDSSCFWFLDSDDPEDNPYLDYVIDQAAHAVTTLRGEGKTVYLHCVMGQSRTPAVGAVYLARKYNMGARDAFTHLEGVLPIVAPKAALRRAVTRLVGP